MVISTYSIPWPRRRILRSILKRSSRLAFEALASLHIEGIEHAPKSGPLIVVSNHFSYLDPALMIGIAPWPLEFLGGRHAAFAPAALAWIRQLWGIFPVFRGTGSRRALRLAESILRQKGVVGIYPEASASAPILRPARPGTAFLAARTGAKILPVGTDGLIHVFPKLREGQRARVKVRFGKPFGPLIVRGRGRERRRQLDRLGVEIMKRIAELIPPERRGHFSDDPAVREAAKGSELYMWDDKPEGQ